MARDLGVVSPTAQPSQGRDLGPVTMDQSRAALANSQMHVDNLRASAAQAKATADAQQSPLGIAKETTKSTLSSIADNGIKFIQSAVHAPIDIAKAGASLLTNGRVGGGPDTSTLPNVSGTGQQTFQGEFASKTLPAVENNQESPLAATAKTVGGVVSGAADVLGADDVGQGITKGIGKLLSRPTEAASNLVKDFAAKRAERQAVKETMGAITPKLTSTEMQEAGAAGRITTPKRGAPVVDFSGDKKFQEIAGDVKGLVNGKDPNVDIHNLRSAIENVSENSVKPFLSENKTPFNFEDLQNKLSLVHPQSSLKADPSALKTYDRVREEVQSNLYSSLKSLAKSKGDFGNTTDFNDVWNARKILDSKAEEELGSKVFGSPEYTGAKSAIQDMRQGLSQFITDSLHYPGQAEQVNKMQEFMQVARQRGIEIESPEELTGLMKQMGIQNVPEDAAKAAFFSDNMRKVSNFYKAIDNVKTKIPDYLRENATFAKRHPLLIKGAKLGASAAGGGALFGVGENLTH